MDKYYRFREDLLGRNGLFNGVLKDVREFYSGLIRDDVDCAVIKRAIEGFSEFKEDCNQLFEFEKQEGHQAREVRDNLLGKHIDNLRSLYLWEGREDDVYFFKMWENPW